MSLLHPLSSLDEFVLVLLTGLVMAILGSMVGLWAWAISRLLRGERLLSPIPILPLGPARWGGRTVSAVILLYLAANLVAGLGFSAARGVRSDAPPADQAREAKEPATAEETADQSADDAGEPGEQKFDDKPKHSSFTLMLLNAIGSLLVLVFLPMVLSRSAGVAISELGFSWKSWPRQVGVGVAAALLTTPVVYSIQSLAVQYWETNDHDVQKMMAENMSPGVAAFALVSTVLLAPLVEESLFRGVLLGWLTRNFSPTSSVAAPKPVADASIRAESERRIELIPAPDSSPDEPGSPSNVVEIAPEDCKPIRPNVVCFQAIIATSLLFAGMHASQWPAPVGIFVLSVVIGFVYQRTGSLLTAMVMHGVFNACGTLLLLQTLLAQSIRDFKPEVPEIAPRLQPAVAAAAAWLSSFF